MMARFLTVAIVLFATVAAHARIDVRSLKTFRCTHGKDTVYDYVNEEFAKQCIGCTCTEAQVTCLIGPDSAGNLVT